MLEFMGGYGLGFVSGVALKNVRSVRRVTATGLALGISMLDVVHRWIDGEESEFRRMLSALEEGAIKARAKPVMPVVKEGRAKAA